MKIIKFRNNNMIIILTLILVSKLTTLANLPSNNNSINLKDSSPNTSCFVKTIRSKSFENLSSRILILSKKGLWMKCSCQWTLCKHKKNIEIGKSASLLSIIMSILDSRRDRESNGLIVCIFFQLFLFWWSKFGTATKILVRFITNLLLMPHRKLVWTKFQF